MQEDRERWNRRYEEQTLLHGETPSPFLVHWLPTILSRVPARQALDLACGEGRNSLFLARHGFQVTAVDIAEKALARGRQRAVDAGLLVDWQEADLDDFRPNGPYGLIININFLQRNLLPQCVAVLSPGGVMVVDTILASPHSPIPHNPSYLLQPGELARIFSGQPGSIVHVEEWPDDATPTAKILFQKQP